VIYHKSRRISFRRILEAKNYDYRGKGAKKLFDQRVRQIRKAQKRGAIEVREVK